MNEGKVCVNFMESLSDSECRLTFRSLRRCSFLQEAWNNDPGKENELADTASSDI